MIKRINGESELDHHRRMIYGKLIDRTLDEDYIELSEIVYGEPSSGDHCRKMMYGSKYTLELMDRYLEDLTTEHSDSEMLDKIEQANILLRKERVKIQDQRRSYQKTIREQARRETTREIIEDTIKKANLPELRITRTERETVDSEMLISLSDLHIGANVDNYWNKYDIDIAKERLSEYFEEIVKVNAKEKCKVATVYANGDIVSGIIHTTLIAASKENLIEQVMIASELISQFLVALSGEFEELNFCSVPGNHSRLSSKMDSPLYERADDLVEFYLKARLQNIENIYFDAGDKIDPTICILTIKGKKLAVVHGDFDSEQKIESLQKFCGVELYGVLTAHKHHLRVCDIRGIFFSQSGSLMGCDDFTVGKRIYGKPSQLLTVFNDKGMECFYNIEFEK